MEKITDLAVATLTTVLLSANEGPAAPAKRKRDGWADRDILGGHEVSERQRRSQESRQRTNLIMWI